MARLGFDLDRVRGLRPTRRGVAVAAVAALAFALAASAGARSLNAVFVPTVVGLAAGAIQVIRADAPTVEWSTPAPGFARETRRVTVDVDSAVPCAVTERVGEGLSTGDAPAATVGHGGTFGYDLRLERRGEYRLGPATCRLTDSLGLFARTVEADSETVALVYPDVYAVEGEPAAVVGRVLGNDRSSFDHLREYAPGDRMRDVHWRASAKRGDEEFLVAEYRSRSEATQVDVVGESAPGDADAMASTVASVALRLHDSGVTAAVTVPGGRCVARPGDAASLLRLLAVTDGGRIDPETRAGADVAVLAEDGRATVSLDDRELEFDRLAGDHRGDEGVA